MSYCRALRSAAKLQVLLPSPGHGNPGLLWGGMYNPCALKTESVSGQSGCTPDVFCLQHLEDSNLSRARAVARQLRTLTFGRCAAVAQLRVAQGLDLEML